MPTSPVTLSVLPSLRSAGIKCRIKHFRLVCFPGWVSTSLVQWSRQRVRRAEDGTWFRAERIGSVLPHGGETTVDLLFPDGTSYSGTAKCSRSDRFNRLEGIRIALGRALAARKGHQHVLKVEAGGFPAV